MPLIKRIVGVGIAAAIAAGLAGRAIERARFGASDDAALQRVERELRERFDATAATLGSMAAQVAAAGARAAPLPPRDPAALRRLFDAASAVVPDEESGRTGVSLYDGAGQPLAWAGRVSDLPKERVLGPTTLLIAPGALGPRLIRVNPLVDNGVRVATTVAEQALGAAQGAPGVSDTFTLATSLVPVTLRARAGAPPTSPDPYRFFVRAPDGGFVLEASVTPADLADARARWRATTRAVVLGVLALTLLLSAGPLIDWRRQMRDMSRFVALTAVLILLLVVVRAVLYIALTPLAPTDAPTPADLLLTTLTLTAVVWLVLDLTERRRMARPRLRLLPTDAGAMAKLAGASTGSRAGG